jgi:hypothetical protein
LLTQTSLRLTGALPGFAQAVFHCKTLITGYFFLPQNLLSSADVVLYVGPFLWNNGRF